MKTTSIFEQKCIYDYFFALYIFGIPFFKEFLFQFSSFNLSDEGQITNNCAFSNLIKNFSAHFSIYPFFILFFSQLTKEQGKK